MTVASMYQAGCRDEYGKYKTWLTALLMADILLLYKNRSNMGTVFSTWGVMYTIRRPKYGIYDHAGDRSRL